MKLGGYSHTNGITFFCDVLKLRTVYKKQEIKYEIKWIIPMKWLRKLEKKPIIGGLSVFYYQWKIFDNKVKALIFSLIMIMFLDEFFHIPNVNNFMNLSINNWWLLGIGVIIFLINFKRMSRLLRYHGAEHKVINCFMKYGYVNEVLAKQSSRFNKRCGTNLATVFLLLYGLFYYFKVESILLAVILLLISIQFIKKMAEKETKWDALLNLLQWVTVWEPSDKELEVAVKGFTKLHQSYLIYQKEVMDRNRVFKA